jgi:hypothetical protein
MPKSNVRTLRGNRWHTWHIRLSARQLRLRFTEVLSLDVRAIVDRCADEPP